MYLSKHIAGSDTAMNTLLFTINKSALVTAIEKNAGKMGMVLLDDPRNVKPSEPHEHFIFTGR